MTESFDINKAKAKIAGHTTSLNAKMAGATKLAQQTLGPQVLPSDAVNQQLTKRLLEVTESFEKLSSLLDDIIKHYEEHPVAEIRTKRPPDINTTWTTRVKSLQSTKNAGTCLPSCLLQ